MFFITTLFVVFSSPVLAGCGPEAKLYQSGQASWYGSDFHGKKAADGSRFDMNKLTIAHKELIALVKKGKEVIVCVLNPRNGKIVVARVTDAGPYVRGRIADLSYAAAREIDIDEVGVAQVQLYVYM